MLEHGVEDQGSNEGDVKLDEGTGDLEARIQFAHAPNHVRQVGSNNSWGDEKWGLFGLEWGSDLDQQSGFAAEAALDCFPQPPLPRFQQQATQTTRRRPTGVSELPISGRKPAPTSPRINLPPF